MRLSNAERFNMLKAERFNLKLKFNEQRRECMQNIKLVIPANKWHLGCQALGKCSG